MVHENEENSSWMLHIREYLVPSWRTYGTCKNFLDTRHSLLSQFFKLLLPDQRFCIVKKCMYVCIYIWLRRDCVWIPVATKQYRDWNVLQKSGAVRSVDWMFIIGAPAWRWLGEYVTLYKTFYDLVFKQEVSSSISCLHVFFLITFLDEAFMRNVIIILCINYVIIICINDNNAVINNNYGRPLHLILLFKIPIGSRHQKDSPALL
jgi:hypothetical protein